jgi:branched-chain amino acid transport system substrate-binding protein
MKEKLSVLVVSGVVLGLLVTACAPKPAAPEKVIKIGVVGPLTGDFAMVGTSQLTGAEMKADEINAAGGDIRIELLSEDDASNCDQSVNATTKLSTQEGAHVILGACNSPCALAMVPVTEKHKTPQFTFGVGAAITEQGSDWIFRVALTCAAQAKELAQFAVKELGHTKFAVMYTDDEYGASCANGFKDALTEMDMEPVAFLSFPRGDKEFSGQLTTVQGSGATAMYVTGDVAGSALIAKQVMDFGLDLQLLGDTGNASPRFAELAGEASIDTLVVEPFTPADPDPKIQEFVAQYLEKYDREADGWVVEMYDTVGLIYEAVAEADKAGKIDWGSPESIRQAIHDYAVGLTADSAYVGVLPGIYFTETGDAYFPLYKVRFKEGGAKEILAQ